MSEKEKFVYSFSEFDIDIQLLMNFLDCFPDPICACFRRIDYEDYVKIFNKFNFDIDNSVSYRWQIICLVDHCRVQGQIDVLLDELKKIKPDDSDEIEMAKSQLLIDTHPRHQTEPAPALWVGAPAPRPVLPFLKEIPGLPKRILAIASAFVRICVSRLLRVIGFPARAREDAMNRSDEQTESSMPSDLRDYIIELDQWAEGNSRDATRDTVAFWILKIPAIVASAGSGVWAYYNLIHVSLISGAIASACIIIDSVHPRGMLRNVHTRAFHEIRSLMAQNVNEWRSRSSAAKPENVAKKIIQGSEQERQRIANYIRDAEAALRADKHE